MLVAKAHFGEKQTEANINFMQVSKALLIMKNGKLWLTERPRYLIREPKMKLFGRTFATSWKTWQSLTMLRWWKEWDRGRQKTCVGILKRSVDCKERSWSQEKRPKKKLRRIRKNLNRRKRLFLFRDEGSLHQQWYQDPIVSFDLSISSGYFRLRMCLIFSSSQLCFLSFDVNALDLIIFRNFWI